MNSKQLAKTIAASLARRQSRGLVDAATGLSDVVIHGRVDLLGVAEDLIAADLLPSRRANSSWATWFAHGAADRKAARRMARARERLIEQIEREPTEAGAALLRLRLRNEPADESVGAPNRHTGGPHG